MATYRNLSLNDTFIKKIVPPMSGRDYYYDSKEQGLYLDVTAKGAMSYYLRKKFNGQSVRIRLGSCNDLTAYEARAKAAEARIKLNNGINPNLEKQKFRQQATLGELYKEYMERYSKKKKKSWKYDEREIPKFLKVWFNRKLSEITKQQIIKLHEKIGEENGRYQANRILERIGSMYNRAIEWGWDGENPAKGVQKFREHSRDRFIQLNEIGSFIEALNGVSSAVVKAYFWMAIYTGQRKSNLLAMRWDEINFEQQIWRIPDSKNYEPINVPLVDAAIELLKKIPRTSEWVFPSKKSESGHLTYPDKTWRTLLKKAGIKNLRIHDIRRTLGSYQSILGSSMQIIGKSLGHKSMQATQVYARVNTDPVKVSMEKALGYMLSAPKG